MSIYKRKMFSKGFANGGPAISGTGGLSFTLVAVEVALKASNDALVGKLIELSM